MSQNSTQYDAPYFSGMDFKRQSRRAPSLAPPFNKRKPEQRIYNNSGFSAYGKANPFGAEEQEEEQDPKLLVRSILTKAYNEWEVEQQRRPMPMLNPPRKVSGRGGLSKTPKAGLGKPQSSGSNSSSAFFKKSSLTPTATKTYSGSSWGASSRGFGGSPLSGTSSTANLVPLSKSKPKVMAGSRSVGSLTSQPAALRLKTHFVAPTFDTSGEYQFDTYSARSDTLAALPVSNVKSFNPAPLFDPFSVTETHKYQAPEYINRDGKAKTNVPADDYKSWRKGKDLRKMATDLTKLLALKKRSRLPQKPAIHSKPEEKEEEEELQEEEDGQTEMEGATNEVEPELSLPLQDVATNSNPITSSSRRSPSNISASSRSSSVSTRSRSSSFSSVSSAPSSPPAEIEDLISLPSDAEEEEKITLGSGRDEEIGKSAIMMSVGIFKKALDQGRSRKDHEKWLEERNKVTFEGDSSESEWSDDDIIAIGNLKIRNPDTYLRNFRHQTTDIGSEEHEYTKTAAKIHRERLKKQLEETQEFERYFKYKAKAEAEAKKPRSNNANVVTTVASGTSSNTGPSSFLGKRTGLSIQDARLYAQYFKSNLDEHAEYSSIQASKEMARKRAQQIADLMKAKQENEAKKAELRAIQKQKKAAELLAKKAEEMDQGPEIPKLSEEQQTKIDEVLAKLPIGSDASVHGRVGKVFFVGYSGIGPGCWVGIHTYKSTHKHHGTIEARMSSAWPYASKQMKRLAAEADCPLDHAIFAQDNFVQPDKYEPFSKDDINDHIEKIALNLKHILKKLLKEVHRSRISYYYHYLQPSGVYEKVDKIAKCVTLQQASEVAILARHIVSHEECSTTLLKCRGFFRWITKFCIMDYLSTKKVTPEEALHARKLSADGFATLFGGLCQEVGIHCVKVRGWNVPLKVGQADPLRCGPALHVWNAVAIPEEKRWALVDCCWSTCIYHGKLEYFYSPAYFDTPPTLFYLQRCPFEAVCINEKENKDAHIVKAQDVHAVIHKLEDQKEKDAEEKQRDAQNKAKADGDDSVQEDKPATAPTKIDYSQLKIIAEPPFDKVNILEGVSPEGTTGTINDSVLAFAPILLGDSQTWDCLMGRFQIFRAMIEHGVSVVSPRHFPGLAVGSILHIDSASMDIELVLPDNLEIVCSISTEQDHPQSLFHVHYEDIAQAPPAASVEIVEVVEEEENVDQREKAPSDHPETDQPQLDAVDDPDAKQDHHHHHHSNHHKHKKTDSNTPHKHSDGNKNDDGDHSDEHHKHHHHRKHHNDKHHDGTHHHKHHSKDHHGHHHSHHSHHDKHHKHHHHHHHKHHHHKHHHHHHHKHHHHHSHHSHHHHHHHHRHREKAQHKPIVLRKAMIKLIFPQKGRYTITAKCRVADPKVLFHEDLFNLVVETAKGAEDDNNPEEHFFGFFDKRYRKGDELSRKFELLSPFNGIVKIDATSQISVLCPVGTIRVVVVNNGRWRELSPCALSEADYLPGVSDSLKNQLAKHDPKNPQWMLFGSQFAILESPDIRIFYGHEENKDILRLLYSFRTTELDAELCQVGRIVTDDNGHFIDAGIQNIVYTLTEDSTMVLKFQSWSAYEVRIKCKEGWIKTQACPNAFVETAQLHEPGSDKTMWTINIEFPIHGKYIVGVQVQKVKGHLIWQAFDLYVSF